MGSQISCDIKSSRPHGRLHITPLTLPRLPNPLKLKICIPAPKIHLPPSNSKTLSSNLKSHDDDRLGGLGGCGRGRRRRCRGLCLFNRCWNLEEWLIWWRLDTGGRSPVLRLRPEARGWAMPQQNLYIPRQALDVSGGGDEKSRHWGR